MAWLKYHGKDTAKTSSETTVDGTGEQTVMTQQLTLTDMMMIATDRFPCIECTLLLKLLCVALLNDLCSS